MSDSRYEKDSLQTIENEKTTPRLVTELKFHDTERDIIWYPSVINMGALGMIFPEGNPKNWKWKYAKIVDIDNANTFDKDDFLSACKEMGITKDLKGDK